MRKLLGVFCLGLLVTVGTYSDPVKSKNDDHIELSIEVGPAFFGGPMVNNIDNILTPAPALVEMSFMVGASYFPISVIGIEAFGQFGTINASSSGPNPFKIFDQGSLLVGPVVRAVFKIPVDATWNISLSGGLQVSGLGWDNDFRSFITASLPGLTLAGITTQPSYYGRFGVGLLSGGMLVGISFMYERLAVTLSNGNDFSADSWSVPIQVGLAF